MRMRFVVFSASSVILCDQSIQMHFPLFSLTVILVELKTCSLSLISVRICLLCAGFVSPTQSCVMFVGVLWLQGHVDI